MARAVGILFAPTKSRGATHNAILHLLGLHSRPSIPILRNQKECAPQRHTFFLAGAVGIEPTQAVLETAVLPLYDAPIKSHRKMAHELFGFFM